MGSNPTASTGSTPPSPTKSNISKNMNNELIKILYKYPRFDELKTEVLNIIQEVNTSFPSWGITGRSFQYRNASEKNLD